MGTYFIFETVRISLILLLILFSFSTAVIPAGDGVYRTIFRGPSQGSHNSQRFPFSNQNHNMQTLFDSSQTGGNYPANESVTYCHPAELVSFMKCR